MSIIVPNRALEAEAFLSKFPDVRALFPDLEEQSCLRERPAAPQETVREHADPEGQRAVEAANSQNRLVRHI